MLNAAGSTSPLAGEHRDSERVLAEAGVPFTVPRNGYYTEGYTGQLGEYLEAGEIVGAAGHGRISAAPRQDYAAAAGRPGAMITERGQRMKPERFFQVGAFFLSECAITMVAPARIPLRPGGARLPPRHPCVNGPAVKPHLHAAWLPASG